MSRGKAIPYSAEELAWLEAHKTLVRGEYARAFNAKFARAVDAINLHVLRKRKGWSTGRSGRFVKGQAAANKGKPCPPGRGRANANYKPIGSERFTKEGYLERKIHDGLPMQSRWRAVHLIRWELAFGPMPAGHCLKCLDGDRANTDPSNWALISRATLGLLNRAWNGLSYEAAAGAQARDSRHRQTEGRQARGPRMTGAAQAQFESVRAGLCPDCGAALPARGAQRSTIDCSTCGASWSTEHLPTPQRGYGRLTPPRHDT